MNKLGKILSITIPVAVIPAMVLPISACAVQADHSDEVIVFADGKTEASIQISNESEAEIKVYFRVKQEGATNINYTLKWYLKEGSDKQLAVEQKNDSQGYYISVIPNKSIYGSGNGWFQITANFTNKYGQKATTYAVCSYTVNIVKPEPKGEVYEV